MAFDSQSRYVLRRFAVKLAFLAAVAVVQAETRWGFKAAMGALAILSALIDAGLAAVRRERPMSGSLNYSDEAIVFLAIGIAARWPP